jgi:CheY-like chemotaxis protein
MLRGLRASSMTPALERNSRRGPHGVIAFARRTAARSTRFPTLQTIAVYEDDDLMRALLVEWLGTAGYSVSARSPCDALMNDAADLVIVSIYMPKQGGQQLVNAVQAAHPNTPLVAISGQFRSGLAVNGAAAQALGVQQVIAKPLSRRDLLAAVCDTIGSPIRTRGARHADID